MRDNASLLLFRIDLGHDSTRFPIKPYLMLLPLPVWALQIFKVTMVQHRSGLWEDEGATARVCDEEDG